MAHTSADPARLKDRIRCAISGADVALHIPGSGVRAWPTARDANRGGTVPHGDDLLMGLGRRWCYSHDVAESGRTDRILEVGSAIHGASDPTRKPERSSKVGSRNGAELTLNGGSGARPKIRPQRVEMLTFPAYLATSERGGKGRDPGRHTCVSALSCAFDAVAILVR